jgi:hypothetical protein
VVITATFVGYLVGGFRASLDNRAYSAGAIGTIIGESLLIDKIAIRDALPQLSASFPPVLMLKRQVSNPLLIAATLTIG